MNLSRFVQMRLQGAADPYRSPFNDFGKSDPPPAPDYAAAAQATAQGNLQAAQQATKANRVNQYTPYGSLTYSQNPDETWNQYVNLSGVGQQLLDQQNKTSMGLAGLQDNAMGRVGDMFSQPFDYGSVQDVQDAAYKSYTNRLDPQWQQRQSALETQLANQGIARGSEAYTNAMRDFNAGRNDAYSQAQVSAINTMPQTMQLASALRNQPLNELNALRTGSQVTNPTFSNVPQQATTAGADMLGATTAGYNAQLGATNASNAASGNFMNGLMGLGGSLGGAAILASDIRLKSNIKRIGKYKHHNVYSYIKFGKPEIGVMAQEVMMTNPEAIHVHPSGYLMVDYAAL